MTEKQSGKNRRQPPPVSLLTRKTPRSRSVSNDLQREPRLQPIRILERQISIESNLNDKQNIEKRNNVAQLIEQYEKSKSTENLHQSTNNLSLLSSSPSIFKSSNDVRTPIIKQQKESLKVLTKTISVLPKSKFETIVHHSTHSISDIIDSNDQISYDIDHSNISYDSQIAPSETISSDLMATSSERSISIPEQFIKSQLDDYMNNNANDELNNVLDQNIIILNESIKEIYTTEVTYVKTLYVLSSKLPVKMKETCQNDENLLQTFNNIYKPLLDIIHRLYKFHYEIILPHFQEYRTNHRRNNIWGLFQEYFQTIEDLYKIYYVTYDEYQRELKRLDKSNGLKKVHNAMRICKIYLGNLCPISEFNCPNQRLLRYILLMKTYMKHLDENSSEYEHTNFIHDEFARIAVRCEEHLMVSKAELNRLKLRVDNKLECFDNQQLLWHGSLKKQSIRKRNDITQVYIILFTHCILVYDESGNKLEIKRQLSIENISVDLMEIRQITPSTSSSSSSNTYYPFRVNAIEKSYEFLVEKESDREKWINKIRQANEDFENQRRLTDLSYFSEKHSIGIRAPIWVYDIDVTRCQICNIRFGLKLIPSVRHHCRACGRCICGSCSTKKLILKYRQKDSEVRVCDTCYTIATGVNRHSISSIKITRNPNKTILFGNFRCISSNSIVWIELQEDYQLHIYAGKLDQVEDFSINLPELHDIIFIEETRTFMLNGKDKRYKYSIELNHQNDYIDENMKNIHNKPSFYAKLWYETMRSARLKTFPLWYIRKRHSTDSGISAV